MAGSRAATFSSKVSTETAGPRQIVLKPSCFGQIEEIDDAGDMDAIADGGADDELIFMAVLLSRFFCSADPLS